MVAPRMQQDRRPTMGGAAPSGGVAPRMDQGAGPAPIYEYTYAELADALQNAHTAAQAGDPNAAAAANQLADAIANREYKESQSDLVSTGMGFSQGATLGLGDEIAAAIRAGTEHGLDPFMYAVGQKLMGGEEGWFGESSLGEGKSFGELVDERYEDFWQGKDYMQRYREALGSGRGMLETARREDPYATFGGEMVGAGMLTGGLAKNALTAGKAAATAKGGSVVPRQAWRLGRLGAGEGAAYGYGSSEASPIEAYAEDRELTPQVMNEIQQAAFDSGVTASVGGGMAATMPLAGVLAKKIGQVFTAPFTKSARLKEGARREVAHAIEQDLAERNITLQQAQEELANTPGMTAADLGQFMQELTETAVTRPTVGAKQLAAFLGGRNVDQWKRMHPKLAEALTGKSEDNFAVAYRNLMKDMRKRADDAYSLAESVPVRITKPMQAIIKNKEFKAALKTANRLRKLDGKKPLPKIRAGTLMSTKEVDQIIQGMDDTLTKAWREAPAVAKRLKPLRNDFREAIYKQNDAYKQARQTWANDKLNEEAMESGLKVFRDDADIVDDLVREMSPAEKEHFKIGALRAITKKLKNKPETADISKELRSRPSVRDAIRVAFGNDAKFDEFMDYVAKEQRMYNTFYQAVGNSRTAKRLAQQEVARGGGLMYALGYFGLPHVPGLSTIPMGLAGQATRRSYEAIANPSPHQIAAMQQQSKELANMLMSKDLNSIMQPHTLGGLLDSGIPVSAATGTTGLIGTAGPTPNVDAGILE